jgi:predicted dienelactone hydrolase
MGIAGHSWGGHTAVVMAGMGYSYDKIKAECDAGTTLDDYACPLLDHRGEIEAMTPDPRLKAVVSWAQDIGKQEQVAGPACAGAPGVTIPWMMINGDTDEFLDTQEDGPDCYAKAGGSACIALLRGAGHMGHTDLGNDKSMDARRALQLIRFYSTAFLLQRLAGNEACGAAMAERFANDGADHDLTCR